MVFYVEEPECGGSGGFSGVEQRAVFLVVSAGAAVFLSPYLSLFSAN